MAHYKFALDIQDGAKAEEHLLAAIQKTYPNAHKISGKHAEYDIIVPEINKTIEVKNDLLASKTGNIAIETNRKDGTLTGILKSTADVWVIYTSNEIFFLDREALKNYSMNNSFRVVYGGDNNATQMVLVPIVKLKEQEFFQALS